MDEEVGKGECHSRQGSVYGSVSSRPGPWEDLRAKIAFPTF